jgi:two-component system, chemotaxis family, sensor kinase Cph1
MQTPAVDLTNCDREPIHIPGSIQSHGVLLAVEEPSLKIVQSSVNAPAQLAAGVRSVNGLSLEAVLGPEAVEALKRLLPSEALDDRPHYVTQLPVGPREERWSAALHRRDQLLLLELQPNSTSALVSSRMQDAVRRAVLDLETCESLLTFCQAATSHFRELTRFDRVMVYRFLEDGTGVVVAESCAEDMEPYLGLRYPASDIPAQARQLYRLNPYRLTADVDAPAIALDPQLNPKTGRPLDLSFCALRATSPIHLEYLRNMGVAASLSFSVLHEEKLWGLIACHHRAPRVLPQEVRIAGEILSRFVGLQIGIKENLEQKQYADRLGALRSQLRSQLTESGDYTAALFHADRNLLSTINAQGIALCTASQTLLKGKTPSQEQVSELVQWVESRDWQAVWATESLAADYPAAIEFSNLASGLLVLRVAQSSPETVLWFRPEVRETVNWAGNPTKPTEKSAVDGSITLHPRRSFALWQEQVGGKSYRWQPVEIEHATALREDMAEALLKHRSLEVTRLNAELTRSNQELEQFAAMASHDLQEPLRVISAYTELVFRRNKNAFDESSTEMIEFIVSATSRMSTLIRGLLEYARSGRREGFVAVDAADSLRLALSNLHAPIGERGAEIHSTPLPIVRAHEEQLARVFQNLIVNALKYCPSDRTPQIQIAAERQGSEWMIAIQDNGSGFDPSKAEAIFQTFYRLQTQDQPGTGLGLAICKKIIQSFGGRIWAETVPGQGSTFHITLPGA